MLRSLFRISALSAALLACAAACPRPAAGQTSAGASAIATYTAGAFPISSLVQAADGNFYGVTEQGGATALGSVQRIAPAGTSATLFSFSGGKSDGGLPVAGLTIGADGALYGTTLVGGANDFGTVYRLALDGAFSLIHSFDPAADGNSPNAALAAGSDGTLYGTLAEGAYDSTTGTYAGGAIFSVSPAGAYATLYQFPADGSAGSQPAARLLEADGQLWGAATSAGANGYGTLFRFYPSTKTMLFVYDLGASDGTVENGLTAYAGSIYGVTYPGALDSGEIFALSFSDQFSVAYTFTGGTSDGGSPASALFPGSDGALWGITQAGGANGTGTFFRYVYGAAPAALFSFPTGTLNTLQDGALVEAGDGSFAVPVLYDTTAGLDAAAMDGAGTLFALTPAYATQPPAPVSLSVSPAVPTPGSTYSLTWQAENAYSNTTEFCIAGGGWSGTQPASGSMTFTAGTSPVTYSLTCGGSVSGSVTVSPAGPAAQVALTAPASVKQGQPGVLTATVTGNSSAPSGTVTFVADGFYTIGTVTLAGGTASLTASTAGVPVGNYSIRATYSGNSTYPAAQSAAASVDITPAKSSTRAVLTITPNPVPANAVATLSVTVSSVGGSGTPGGTVSLYADGYALGSATLSGGAASLQKSVAGVPAGTYSVTAVYSGDASDDGTTSPAVEVTVE